MKGDGHDAFWAESLSFSAINALASTANARHTKSRNILPPNWAAECSLTSASFIGAPPYAKLEADKKSDERSSTALRGQKIDSKEPYLQLKPSSLFLLNASFK